MPSIENAYFSRLLTLIVNEQQAFNHQYVEPGSRNGVMRVAAEQLYGLYEQLYFSKPVEFRLSDEQRARLEQHLGNALIGNKLMLHMAAYKMINGVEEEAVPDVPVLDQRKVLLSLLPASEVHQRSKWQEACRAASVIIHDKSHPRYMEMYERWREQLTVKELCMQFPNFVRAELVKELQE